LQLVTIPSIILLLYGNGSAGLESGVPAVKFLRVLRTLRLLTVIPTLQHFVGSFFETMLIALPFMLLVGYGMISFAILGIYEFGDRWDISTDGYDTPVSFEVYQKALTVVASNWHGAVEVGLFYSMYKAGAWAAVFFMAEIAIGTILLGNMTVAVLYRIFHHRQVCFWQKNCPISL
jgi:voltage-gated sodium channel